MEPISIKWHNHFNWSRLGFVGCAIFGVSLLCVATHNFTSMHCASIAREAASVAAGAGVDPIQAAQAVGPEATQQNQLISWINFGVGLVATLAAIVRAWNSTAGGSTVERINAAIQAAKENNPFPTHVLDAPVAPLSSSDLVSQIHKAVDTLLEKASSEARQAAANNLAKLAESAKIGGAV